MQPHDITSHPKHIRRFWSKVDIGPEDHCWTWTGRKHQQGYGWFDLDTSMILAHRMCWVLIHGHIPNDLCCLHTCDNPSCVNPNHLWLGSHTDNMQDMLEKGRGNHPKGAQHYKAVLSEVDILSIRDLYPQTSAKILAQRFNVTPGTIYHIVQRHTWKHI